jgi:ribosomal protein S6--L-glutamate ligase
MLQALILSSSPEAQSNTLLRQSLKQIGIQSYVVDPRHCEWSLNSRAVFYRGNQLPSADMSIPRLGFWTYKVGLSLHSTLEAHGAIPINSFRQLCWVSQKPLLLAELKRHGVPVPQTWFFHREENPRLWPHGFSDRVVFKTYQGSQGKGVAAARGEHDQKMWMDFLRTAKVDFLAQEFIVGEDIRSLWFRDQPLGTIARHSQNNDFRANLHLGGHAEKTQLRKKEQELCRKVMQITGLDFAGIDFFRRPQGPVFLEVNPYPGFTGLAKALGHSFPRKLSQALKQL